MWGAQPNSLQRSQLLLLYVDFINTPSWMEAYLLAHILSSSLPSHCISSLFLHYSCSLQVKVSSFTKLCASLHWRHAFSSFVLCNSTLLLPVTYGSMVPWLMRRNCHTSTIALNYHHNTVDFSHKNQIFIVTWVPVVLCWTGK